MKSVNIFVPRELGLLDSCPALAQVFGKKIHNARKPLQYSASPKIASKTIATPHLPKYEVNGSQRKLP
jgi:hypothetical protein